ncbi:MBL fold metallo-hydrolase [Listeria welshimeri]|uniref:MBL fold metallo-hydrolase n=1 Tax=Listeria welshimeri TaxID=1643 RepID=UPI001625AA81|nr:MBL fold metallo-hydrolase [Listeria welshimeri]MBC1982106.1 MBL fold metallo-hydrolase [Listeria welshimeri]MBF2352960.1 MBL fold metallo-hydrolase [Listeria welshimeri]
MKTISKAVLIIISIMALSACKNLLNQDSINTPSATPSNKSNNTKAKAGLSVKTFSSSEGFSCEVHVLSSEKGNILVDPGFYDNELAEYVKSIGGLDVILITHGHWDNIHALDAIVKANPNAEVFIHELDIPFLRDPHLNCSDINGFSLLVDTKPKTFTEGFYTFSGYHIEVMHTPGHTIGSSSFYLPEENILFSGDTFMLPFVGSADHPTGSETDRNTTINQFKERDFRDDMKIYPGHRGNTTYKEMMEKNIDLQ